MSYKYKVGQSVVLIRDFSGCPLVCTEIKGKVYVIEYRQEGLWNDGKVYRLGEGNNWHPENWLQPIGILGGELL